MVLFLYCCSAFFSGSEAALFVLKHHEIDMLRYQQNRVKRLLSQPRKLLIAILFSNLLVNTLAAALVEGIAEKYVKASAIPASIAIGTILVLIFGEALPKNIAFNHRKLFASIAAPFIDLVFIITKPIIAVIFPITKLFTKSLEGSHTEKITEEDIKHFVSHSEDEGHLDLFEERCIHSIFALDKKRAVDVMIPKERVSALPRTAEESEAIELIRKTRFSRIPIYVGSIDRIVGILYAKDLIIAKAKGIDAKPAKIAREPIFVPRWKRCDLLLNELRARKTHMAVVVDEFGNTLGIIALDSILQEIIGKMKDTPYSRKDPE